MMECWIVVAVVLAAVALVIAIYAANKSPANEGMTLGEYQRLSKLEAEVSGIKIREPLHEDWCAPFGKAFYLRQDLDMVRQRLLNIETELSPAVEPKPTLASRLAALEAKRKRG